MKFEPIELTARDMEFVRLRKISRDEIIAACKIPRLVKGKCSHANYGKGMAELMYKLWWEATFGVTQCTI